MENQKKVVAIEIGPETEYASLTKHENFTTNANYLGHTPNGIPVYRNESLVRGDIKTIMSNLNQSFEKLEPGKYNAKCLQVFNKHPNEDPSKEVQIVELEVQGQEKKQYVTYFVKGYSEKQMEVSKDNIDTLLVNFGLKDVKELEGKDVLLTVKKNNKGYINYFIYPIQKKMKWEYDCEIPCKIFSSSKKTDTNNIILGVKFRTSNEEYVEFVWYNLNNQWSQKDLQTVCNKAGLNINALPPQLDVNAFLKVSKTQSKKDPTQTFFVKKIIIK